MEFILLFIYPIDWGSFVHMGSQTLEAPEIVAQVFHEDERLYTLMLVDPGKIPLRVPVHVSA